MLPIEAFDWAINEPNMAALINVWHLTDSYGALSLFQYHHAKMSENVAVPLLKAELLACIFKSDILSLFLVLQIANKPQQSFDKCILLLP